ncbi:MAG TPA: hypothetical protein VFB41_02135 [Solirubrobacteraceae bacterium]|nr:hypothetical protein [Solirubrobacteraceae bacterium]
MDECATAGELAVDADEPLSPIDETHNAAAKSASVTARRRRGVNHVT